MARVTTGNNGRQVPTEGATCEQACNAVIAYPLQHGQDIIVRVGSSWQEAVIIKAPKGGSAATVAVVDKVTWKERRVLLADVAIRATAAKSFHRNPEAVAAARAKAIAARAARALRRAQVGNKNPRCSAVHSPTSKGGVLFGKSVLAQLKSATQCVAAPKRGFELRPSMCRPAEAGLEVKELLKVDKALHAKVDGGELPGVINVVFRKGMLAHLDCYGYADLERKTPMKPDTIVRLYSMTKCIASVALCICVESGLLQLEDEVSKYIPAFTNMKVRRDGAEETETAQRPITVLHLLTHTSGLGSGPMLADEPDGEGEERFIPLIRRAGLGRTNPTDPEAILSLEHWCSELAKIPLRSQPGEEWFYSYSHDVAGRVVEVVTGVSLDVFVEESVCKPLGMHDTSFNIPEEKWDRVAGIYRRVEVEQSDKGKEDDKDDKSEDKEEHEDENEEGAAAGEGEHEGEGENDDNKCENEEKEADRDNAEKDEADGSKDGNEGSEEDRTVYKWQRLDNPDLKGNEWISGNACPILSAGGSVDGLTGGLASTAADYSRFCMMLLGKGSLDGVRILKPETVQLLTTNQLPRATGGQNDVWAFGSAGMGFCLIGAVSIAHPDLDPALRPPEYGWGGMAGTAWTNDPKEEFSLLSFSLTAFDLTTEEELRAGVRAAIAKFDEKTPRRPQLDAVDQMEDDDDASTVDQTPPAKRARTPVAKRAYSPSPEDESDASAPKRRQTELEIQLGSEDASLDSSKCVAMDETVMARVAAHGSANQAVGKPQFGDASQPVRSPQPPLTPDSQ